MIFLQHTATHCITLQRTATHCNTLQHSATLRNTHRSKPIPIDAEPQIEASLRQFLESFQVLLCVALVLQCVAVCCSVAPIFRKFHVALRLHLSLESQFSEKNASIPRKTLQIASISPKQCLDRNCADFCLSKVFMSRPNCVKFSENNSWKAIVSISRNTHDIALICHVC